MKDVSAEEILDMLTRMNPFKVSKILDIPLDVIYKKLEQYEEETGKKIGNLNNLRRKNSGMPAERLLKLYRSGMSIEEIGREKRMRVETVKRILRKYFEEKGEEVPEEILKEDEPKPKVKKPKEVKKPEKEIKEEPEAPKTPEIPETSNIPNFTQLQKDIIYLYYNKDKSPQEIIEHFAAKGKDISLHEILDAIEKHHRIISTHKKRKNEIESETAYSSEWQAPTATAVPVIKKLEKSSIDVDKAIKEEMLLKGISLRRWAELRDNALYLDEVKKRLAQLRVVASHVRKIDNDKYVEDTAFLEVLDLLENPDIVYPYNRFRVSLSQYVALHGVCQFGKIDSINNITFKSNSDLTAYVVSGLGLQFKGYDLNVWENTYRKNFINKIDLYMGRLQAVNAARKENKQKEGNGENKAQKKPNDDKKELR